MAASMDYTSRQCTVISFQVVGDRLFPACARKPEGTSGYGQRDGVQYSLMGASTRSEKEQNVPIPNFNGHELCTTFRYKIYAILRLK